MNVDCPDRSISLIPKRASVEDDAASAISLQRDVESLLQSAKEIENHVNPTHPSIPEASMARPEKCKKLCKLGMEGKNFGWTIRMQIKAANAGVRHLEIPVLYRNRAGTSKMSGTVSGSFRAGYKILYTIARYGLRRSKMQPFAFRTHCRVEA